MGGTSAGKDRRIRKINRLTDIPESQTDLNILIPPVLTIVGNHDNLQYQRNSDTHYE